MSFERARAQVTCEAFVGCTSIESWKNRKAVFEQMSLDATQVSTLKTELVEDSLLHN